MAPSRPGERPDEPSAAHRLRPADLSQRHAHAFTRTPDAAACAAIAELLGLSGLRKVRLDGHLTPIGRGEWDLSAQLGATVVQPCVVTFAPVTTRIDEPVLRRYRADLPDFADEGGEIEMPEDDTLEPLPEVIDLDAVLTEALSLALPPYPRADGVDPVEAVFAEPGKTPLTDDALRPFSGLAGLKDRLAPREDDPSEEK